MAKKVNAPAIVDGQARLIAKNSITAKKAEPPMTTKKPADGLRPKNSPPRDPQKVRNVSRAVAGLGADEICRVQIGDVNNLRNWIAKNLPEIATENYLVTPRTDGRVVAAFNVPFTVALALRLIRLNSHNRKFRGHHAQIHAEKFRSPMDDQNGFDSDISQFAIFFSFDPTTGELVVAALADGQHRAMGKIGSDGSAVDYHTAWHYLDCHRANLDKSPEDMRNLDWVSVKDKTEYDEPTTGEVKSGYIIPLDQWQTKVAEAVKRGDAGKLALASLVSTREQFVSWTLRDNLKVPHEVSDPVVVLLVGSHMRTLAKHDQDNLARSGGDELDMSTTTGPVLRQIGLDSETAATWVRNLYLRIKPQTTLVDEEGNETIKRRELHDGGKPIAAPSYPAYFQSPEIQPRIEATWEQWKRLAGIAESWGPENAASPLHAKHPAYEVATYAREACGWSKEKFERTGGYMIPDNLVRLAASLIESRNVGKTEKEYSDEIAEFILRASYGVAVTDEGHYIPDGVFTDVRQWILNKREGGGTFKAGELLDQLAYAWNYYSGLLETEDGQQNPCPTRFCGIDDEGNFVGADLNGMTPDDLKAIQAAQRGAEYVPGRKRGRPPGAKGKKVKA